MRRALALFAFAALAAAQAPPSYEKFSRPPDLKDVAYGPHSRNVLDLWMAKPDRPTPLVVFIHGGGFRAGDKTALSPTLLDYSLEAGFSVASINYRLTDTAPYPAPMHDGARAIQFLRSKAKEWNLDPRRIGASGGSAGAGISLWTGFHDDMADPSSDDPVKRQSTRLTAMAVLGAQSSYDPRLIRSLIGEAAARHPALEPFYGLHGPDLESPKAFRLFEDASPVTHLSKGDPPAFLYYDEPDAPLPADAKPGTGIHHPRFGRYLKERMDKLGIECIVRHTTDYGALVPRELRARVDRDIVAFFKKHLQR